MKILLIPLLFCSALLAQASANVEITELLVDPVGPNAGAQIVEIQSRYLGADTTGWHLVTPAGAFAIPSVLLMPGQVALLHIGRSGTSSSSDIYLPAVPELTMSSSLALFRSQATTLPTEVIDFVSWGNGTGAIAVAVAAGEWPSTTATVAVPTAEGHTLAHYGPRTYASRSAPDAWFQDGTPTLGAPNDGGGITAGPIACPQLLYGPSLGAGTESNRPWLGETWTLDAYYLPPVPSTMFLAFGFDSLGGVPLDQFGIIGCYWEVNPIASVLVALPATGGTLAMPLPLAPAFVGVRLRLQGLVTYQAANPANLLPTRAVNAYLGLR